MAKKDAYLVGFPREKLGETTPLMYPLYSIITVFVFRAEGVRMIDDNDVSSHQLSHNLQYIAAHK